jgi:ornithine carbamoyltransferase
MRWRSGLLQYDGGGDRGPSRTGVSRGHPNCILVFDLGLGANVTKRDFLRLTDLNHDEARHVFALSAKLKASPKGSHITWLAGRAVAVVFEKASTRTRVSFEVGISQLGAQPVILSQQGSQLGRGEPIEDTARVLSRYCDAIAFRTFGQERLTAMATATVPVINALSDEGHPVQVLCDVFTIEEQMRTSIRGKRVAFIGDCASNMARSWVEAARIFEFHLALGAPEGFFPPPWEVEASRGHVSLHTDPIEAVKDAHVVNTDVWASMGQEDEAERRREAFQMPSDPNHIGPWTVTEALMANAAREAIVLHCLPAHRGEEIDAETLEGPRSRVWDQAENRLHVQKGLLCFLLGVGS